jgi:hypothetical protein
MVKEAKGKMAKGDKKGMGVMWFLSRYVLLVVESSEHNLTTCMSVHLLFIPSLVGFYSHLQHTTTSTATFNF